MASVYTPNTVEAAILMSLDNQQIENTLWFEFSTNPDASNLEELCQTLINWWTGEMAPYLSTALSLRGARAVSMNSSTSPTAQLAPASPTAGEVAGDCVPGNVAFCVQFKSFGRGRSTRGRNYIPGIPMSQLSGINEVGSSFATAMINAYLAILGDTYTFIPAWVINSKFSGGAPRTTGVNSVVTSVVYADLYLDSQRRRLPGRGS